MCYPVSNVLSTEVSTKVFQAIRLNEIGGNDNHIYSFSDPDGRNTGKSGYSFGMSQFDIQNNWTGIDCLQDCGFTPKEVTALFKQNDPEFVERMASKLRAHKDTVDDYDRQHLSGAIKYCQKVLVDCGITQIQDIETFVHMVDYHNQFDVTWNGKIHKCIKDLADKGQMLTPEFFLDFKLNNTAWGKKRPDDVKRRYNNIHSLFA